MMVSPHLRRLTFDLGTKCCFPGFPDCKPAHFSFFLATAGSHDVPSDGRPAAALCIATACSPWRRCIQFGIYDQILEAAISRSQ